jgi:sec-independent protein translocase protein TatB
MFEVGFTEIVLIFGIALLVLGPERLPKLAADVGRWAGRARAMARQLRTQLEQEVQYDPLRDEPKRPTTIHTPPTPPPDSAARTDESDESKPA